MNNKFDCDDVFKRIESKTVGALANDINKALKELQKLQPAVQHVEDVQSKKKERYREAVKVTNFINGQSGALRLIILIVTL